MALSEAATSTVAFGTPEVERGRAESRTIADSSQPDLVTRVLFGLYSDAPSGRKYCVPLTGS
jgi:hypothetical protein